MLTIAFVRKKRSLGQSHVKFHLSHGPPFCTSRPTERLATHRRSFSLRPTLAQELDDLLIALFHRLIQRRFPLRVLLVDVRFLIQEQFYHLLFAANDSLVQK